MLHFFQNHYREGRGHGVCGRDGCSLRCVEKPNGEFLAVCSEHLQVSQQVYRPRSEAKRADKKNFFLKLISQQGYGPSDPMPVYCSCSFKRNPDTVLEFERKSDRSWNRRCTICNESSRRSRKKQAFRIEDKLQRGATEKECIRCFDEKPLEKFRRASQKGDARVFQKCNLCCAALRTLARKRRDEWRKKTSNEKIEDFEKTGCTGWWHGRSNKNPCFFVPILQELKRRLPKREFALLFDYDHSTEKGPIEDYMMVSQIIEDTKRQEVRAQCSLKCVYCHHIKTLLCGDYLHGNGRWEVEGMTDPDPRKLELKKLRYLGQDRGCPGNCQGPDYGMVCLFQTRFDELLQDPSLLPENFHFGRFFEWDHVLERRMGDIPSSRMTNWHRHLIDTFELALRCRGCHRIKSLRNDDYVAFRLNLDDFLEEELK
jgi:hypothetical protein